MAKTDVPYSVASTPCAICKHQTHYDKEADAIIICPYLATVECAVRSVVVSYPKFEEKED